MISVGVHTCMYACMYVCMYVYKIFFRNHTLGRFSFSNGCSLTTSIADHFNDTFLLDNSVVSFNAQARRLATPHMTYRVNRSMHMQLRGQRKLSRAEYVLYFKHL